MYCYYADVSDKLTSEHYGYCGFQREEWTGSTRAGYRFWQWSSGLHPRVAQWDAADSASAAAESAASASLLAEQAASQLVDSFRFQYQLLLENQPSEHEGPARRKVWEATVADVRQRLVSVCSEHIVLAMEQRKGHPT